MNSRQQQLKVKKKKIIFSLMKQTKEVHKKMKEKKSQPPINGKFDKVNIYWILRFFF